MIHGIDCPKVKHEGSGHLHGEGEDGPYDVDGITYCGRCHHYLTKEDQTIISLFSRITALEQKVAQMRDLLDDPSKAYYEKRKELPLEAV